MAVSRLEMPFRRVHARLAAGVLTGGVRTSSRGSRVRRIFRILGECSLYRCPDAAGTLPGAKQDAEPMSPSGGGGDPGYTLRGIPFCEACAREQEAYFAIGELTQEQKRDLRGEPISKSLGETLGEMLEGMRRQRTDDLGAAKRLDLPRVDKPGSLRLRKARQSQPESRQNRG